MESKLPINTPVEKSLESVYAILELAASELAEFEA